MKHGAGGRADRFDAYQPLLVGGAEPELDALLCVVVVAEPELDAHQQQLVVVAAGGAGIASAVPGEGDELAPSSPERRKIPSRRW